MLVARAGEGACRAAGVFAGLFTDCSSWLRSVVVAGPSRMRGSYPSRDQPSSRPGVAGRARMARRRPRSPPVAGRALPTHRGSIADGRPERAVDEVDAVPTDDADGGTGRGSCALIARFKVSLPTLGARSLHARIRTEKGLLLRQVRLPITPRAVGGTRRSRTADLAVSAGSNRVPRHRGFVFQEEGRRIERLRFRAPRSSNPVTRH